MGTVDCSPMRSMPQPHWNTATIAPYAAPTDSRFMTAAVSGTSTEWNTSINSRNDSSTTAPMNQGSRAAIWSPMSMYSAVSPPTKAFAPVVPSAAGRTSSRNVVTSDAVCALSGAVVGNTTTTATSPAGLNCAGSTLSTPGVRASAVTTACVTGFDDGSDAVCVL